MLLFLLWNMCFSVFVISCLQITRVRDLMRPGLDTGLADKKPNLPLGSSPHLTLWFSNGAVFTLRGSGTEPKLKYYSELPGNRGEAVQNKRRTTK
jgi:phosphomannomutase